MDEELTRDSSLVTLDFREKVIILSLLGYNGCYHAHTLLSHITHFCICCSEKRVTFSTIVLS